MPVLLNNPSIYPLYIRQNADILFTNDPIYPAHILFSLKI